MTYTVKVYASSEAGNGEPTVYSVKQYAADVLADESQAEYHDAMRALLNHKISEMLIKKQIINLFRNGINFSKKSKFTIDNAKIV